ncbi:MAG: penicillin-binding protein activator [Pseudomonadota bacterium]|nr:MAG: penicillin-binding protein activator [Pseudomonadota bacterium]
MKSQFPNWCVIALVATVLAGCETPRVAVQKEPPAISTETAEKAESDGEFVIAAREYERLAQTTEAPQRQQLQLKSVDNLLKAGQLPEARIALEAVDVTALDSSYYARKKILEARLASLGGKHERAIRLLDQAQEARNLNPALIADIYLVRAQAELALNNPTGAVRNRIAREQYIANREIIAENQKQIWETLGAMPRERRIAALNVARDLVLAGWLELSLAAMDSGTSQAALAAAIERWKQSYPKHPAQDYMVPSLLARASDLIGRIERIALLLPLTSDYAVPAQSLRDGFLAVDAINPDPTKPQIRVYDIGADPTQAPIFYSQAVLDGAQLIVGPLGRDAVDSLIRSGVITVPTMLLSHTDEESAAAGKFLFQFGLPPEQEAKQAAQRAYLDGHRRAVVLYQKSSWGERMQSAFVAQWERLGGTILAAEAYQADGSDYSEPIKRLLNINQSEARRGMMEAKVAQKLQFEARTRQDVEMVFLAADAASGRLIKPQLNFFRASRLPVYATSAIFSGKSDEVHDRDLDGVVFGDMPWMLLSEGSIAELRAKLQGDWPHARTGLDRLYALGIDSYAVIPYLSRINADDGARFSGVTSSLSIDRTGRLQRQLLWARFSRGTPRLLDRGLKDKARLKLDTTSGG